MADKYATPEAAVQALLPGWHITGATVVTRKKPNLNRTTINDPSEIDEPYGTEYTVQNADGTQHDTITLSNLSATDFGAPGQPGTSGPAISVLVGPTKNPPVGSTTNKPSNPSQWTTVYRVPGDASSGTLGQWDPVNNEFHSVGAAPDAKPTGKFSPVIVGEGTNARQVGLVDDGGKSFHPVAAPPDVKPSGNLKPSYAPNADGTQRLIGMVDEGDKSFHPVSADPTLGRQVVQTPDKLYVFNDKGEVVNTVAIDKKSPYQAVIVDGVPYSFDPNETDPNKRFTKAPGDWQHPPIKDADQNPMTWDDAQGKYVYPAGTGPKPTLQTNTTARTLDWYDASGNLIKSVKNPNYVEPKVDQPNLPATNTVAPMILVPDPDKPGNFKWIKNESRVTASQALQNLASNLSGHVVDGNITVDEAKAIIDAANQQMATQASAASTALSAMNQGAVAGANLLNQRSQAAQSFVQQGLGLLGQTKHGLLVAPPSDFGANLVQGAAGFATELGGGPEVFQAAANLVRRADPTGSMGQDAAAAYSTLTQMFQKYRQTHGGQPAPEEVAALKGGPLSQPNEVNQNAFASLTPSAAPWQRADQAAGTTPAGNALAAPGMAGTVNPGDANYLGFKAPTPGLYSTSYLNQYPSAVGQPATGPVVGQSVPLPAPVPNPPMVMAPMASSFSAPPMPTATSLAPITPQNRNITITVP